MTDNVCRVGGGGLQGGCHAMARSQEWLRDWDDIVGNWESEQDRRAEMRVAESAAGHDKAWFADFLHQIHP